MQGQFEKYLDMVRSVSWKISKKYNLDYDEIESQGFLIYCLAVENYDISKASFSTHLYINLNGRLKDYALSVKRIDKWEGGRVYELQADCQRLDPFLFTAESRDYELANDFFEKARKNLDSDSYNVFEFIASFEWLKNGRAKPTISDVMRKFGIDREKANVLWNNCRAFWRNAA